MAKDVLISYSSKDAAKAFAICKALEDSSILCWIAPRNILPGRDWMESIVQAIEEIPVILLVFSEHSNVSKQVKKELEVAERLNKTICPIMISRSEPQGSIMFIIQNLHRINAFQMPIENHLNSIVREVKGAIARTMDHDVVLPAPTPVRKQWAWQSWFSAPRKLPRFWAAGIFAACALLFFIGCLVLFSPIDHGGAKIISSPTLAIRLMEGETLDIYRQMDEDKKLELIKAKVAGKFEVPVHIGDKFWLRLKKGGVEVQSQHFNITNQGAAFEQTDSSSNDP